MNNKNFIGSYLVLIAVGVTLLFANQAMSQSRSQSDNMRRQARIQSNSYSARVKRDVQRRKYRARHRQQRARRHRQRRYYSPRAYIASPLPPRYRHRRPRRGAYRYCPPLRSGVNWGVNFGRPGFNFGIYNGW